MSPPLAEQTGTWSFDLGAIIIRTKEVQLSSHPTHSHGRCIRRRITPIVDCDVLEAAKENIQPLASGRRVTALSAILTTPHAQRERRLASDRTRYRINVEVALQDEDDDPLEAYCRFVYWTVENYPQGHSAESGLLELLEEATRVLKDDRGGKWRDDFRYLKLWVLYATYVEKPAIVYKFLVVNDIGTSYSLLYEEFAVVLERAGRRTEADETYLLGIARKASPMDPNLPAPPPPAPAPSSIATTARRAVLGETATATTTPSSSRRVTRSSTRNALIGSTTTPSSSSTTAPRSNARLQVFIDPSGSSESNDPTDSPTPWPELGTRKSRIKENIKEVSKAAGTTLRQAGRAQRAAAAAAPKMVVYRDTGEEDDATETPPPPAPAAKKGIQKASAPKLTVFRDTEEDADAEAMPPPPLPAAKRGTQKASASKLTVFRDTDEDGDAEAMLPPPIPAPKKEKGIPSTPKFVPFRDEECGTPSTSSSVVPDTVMKLKAIGTTKEVTMSFQKGQLYPCAPATTRGESTKLSASKDKIVYTNGRSVIIRDLKNPAVVTAYAGHVQTATVARISPSGYYCASADITGTLRVWDTVGEDQTLKAEYKVISGRVNDLEWDGESKRIIAVGDGRDKFGHAFMMDSGSSTGEIIGHSKIISAVTIRHQRPFRAATASDDATIVFHQDHLTGVPFKYEKTIKTHTKFVQDVRYAPSGEQFASVGSDAKIFIYEGKTGETLGKSPIAHILEAFPDSKSLITSSADCTVKLWDVETKKAVTTWTLGSGVPHQQVGNVWTEGDDIVSLSMSGNLNIFDKRVGDKPARVLYGPQKSITASVPTSSGTFLAGTADGRILSFSDDTYSNVTGEGHASLVAGLAPAPDGKVFSIGFDDHLREIDGSASFVPAVCPTSSQPKALAVAGDSTVFIAELNGVEAIRSNQKVFELQAKFTPSAVAAAGSFVAVGGEVCHASHRGVYAELSIRSVFISSQDQKVHLYDWDGKTLKEVATLDGNKGVVSALAFSPDGSLLAAGDSSGRIVLFDVKERKVITSRWSFHSGRIHSLSWTADGQHCASGSLDTHVYVWSVQKPMRNIAIKNAGPGGVNAVFWLKDGQLASAGADGCVRLWNITFHE
ncbi:putative WD repeat-containing protein C9G1.05 [Grifola frondosa]|uniref:Putative WD repeat-containing protein C9G1.05 n=1 Tax=Grifola frondosa TaxID=5627 RepID=A0A1C7LUC7_GRIFR|nr:putative WD repeat-containing protein C9G1.05 [Grifola frondosa]